MDLGWQAELSLLTVQGAPADQTDDELWVQRRQTLFSRRPWRVSPSCLHRLGSQKRYSSGKIIFYKASSRLSRWTKGWCLRYPARQSFWAKSGALGGMWRPGRIVDQEL
jgi:hypothetical protein